MHSVAFSKMPSKKDDIITINEVTDLIQPGIMESEGAVMLQTLRNDMDQMEELYNSLGSEITSRGDVDAGDRDKWMAAHDTLQSHITEMTQVLEQYQQNEEQVKQQVAEENERRQALNADASDADQLKTQIAALRAQIDENAQNLASAPWADPNNPLSINPYTEIAEILDQIEKVHAEQEKAWAESHKHSQDVIKSVIDMLDDSWPDYPQRMAERDEQIERLREEIARRDVIESEQEKVHKQQTEELQTLTEIEEREKSEIEELRSKLKAQEEIISQRESEMESLNEEISTLKSTTEQIDELQSQLNEEREINSAKSSEIESLNEQIAVMEEEKRETVENEVAKSSATLSERDEEIEKLKKQLSESEEETKRMKKRVETVEEEREEAQLQNKALQVKQRQLERQTQALQDDNERLQSQLEEEEEEQVVQSYENGNSTHEVKEEKKKPTNFNAMSVDQYILYLKDF